MKMYRAGEKTDGRCSLSGVRLHVRGKGRELNSSLDFSARSVYN